MENNESNSWTVPAGSEAGMTNAAVEIQWLCCSTPVSFPKAQPQWGYWLMFVSQGGLSSHWEHREWFGCGRYRQGGVEGVVGVACFVSFVGGERLLWRNQIPGNEKLATETCI